MSDKKYVIAIVVLLSLMLCLPVNAKKRKGIAGGSILNQQQTYAELVQRLNSINSKILELNNSIGKVSNSKARKISRRLSDLESEKAGISKMISTFPPEVVNPDEADKILYEKARQDVLKSIEEKMIARGDNIDSSEELAGDWSIVISMSKSSDITPYKSYGSGIEVEKLGDRFDFYLSKSKKESRQMADTYIFYLGHYSSREEAEVECQRLIKSDRCRDAFVIKRR